MCHPAFILGVCLFRLVFYMLNVASWYVVFTLRSSFNCSDTLTGCFSLIIAKNMDVTFSFYTLGSWILSVRHCLVVLEPCFALFIYTQNSKLPSCDNAVVEPERHNYANLLRITARCKERQPLTLWRTQPHIITVVLYWKKKYDTLIF